MKALTASITDRANPIFLQALRQSLRGRMFQILFWVTLLLAMAFSLLFVIIGTRDDGEPSGPIYFLWIYAALSFAVHLFVPFSAFLSLGNEWDENTYDLLVLSNLKPRQIVGGKLLSALLQAGLWFSAFGPFLTFSFLLPGLDLVALGLVMLLTAFSSTCLTCVALCLSAAARGRFVRTFLMAILGLFLSFVAFMAVLSAFQIVDNPTEIRSDFGRQMIIGFLTGLVVLGSYCFAFACTRLAHEEENRSSGLRVISSLVLVAVWWWLTSLYRMSGQQQEMILTTGMLGILLVTLFSVLYAHEDARLGRRVQLDIPRSRIGAFLSTPWLPGGARGILWHCLHLGVWVLALYLTCRIWPPTTAFLPEHSFGTGWWIAIAYTWLYLAVPALVYRRWLRHLSVRVLARVSVLGMAFLFFLLPTLALFLFTGGGDEVIEHLGNPFQVIDGMFDQGTSEAQLQDRALAQRSLWIVSSLGVVLLLLHLPGMVRGFREVLSASAARRA